MDRLKEQRPILLAGAPVPAHSGPPPRIEAACLIAPGKGATVEPDETVAQNSRYLVETALREAPDRSAKDIAEQCGVSVRYVQRIRREQDANNHANSGANSDAN